MGEDEEKTVANNSNNPTHWSQLDIKSMKVNELRIELTARGIDSKGIKSQLVAKLMKAVKGEQEAEAKSKEQPTTEDEEQKMDLVVVEEATGDAKPDEGNEQMSQDVEMKPEVEEKTETNETNVKEEPKPKMRDEKEIKESKSKLERAYDFRPTQPGILVHPNRSAKAGKFDCRVMSLNSLLDYRPEDNKEHSFEVSLFAEAFGQMLVRDNAFKIFKALASFVEVEDKEEKAAAERKAAEKTEETGKNQETEKPSSADAIEKDADAAKEAPKETETKDATKSAGQNSASKKDAKSKRRSHSPSSIRDEKKLVKPNDPLLLQSFLYFDQNFSGYVASKDLDDILLSLGLRLTRSQIQKLTKKVISRDVLHYRKLTDVIYSKETKEIKIEPKFNELPADEELSIGNTALIFGNKEAEATKSAMTSPRATRRGASTSMKNEIVDVSAVGTVSYKGSIVDVGQLLSQIEKLEQERKTLEQRLTVLDKDLGNYKDQKHSLERRKRRLEDDLKDAKKRLYDAEKCLKNSQDDTVQLKTSLHRCKEYSESIARLVDKTLPAKKDKEESGKNKSSAPVQEKGESQETAAATAAAPTDSQDAKETEGNAQEQHGPAPDEELAVREEVTESDRTEAELNLLSALGEDNMQ